MWSVAAVRDGIPATSHRMTSIRTATAADGKLQTVIKYIQSGWPEYINNVDPSVWDFYTLKGELSTSDGLVTRGNRIVIPDQLQHEIIERIHDGHQGLTKCRERANTAVWWPGMSAQIKQKVLSCRVCQEQRKSQRREPLIPTPLPDRPWRT